MALRRAFYRQRNLIDTISVPIYYRPKLSHSQLMRRASSRGSIGSAYAIDALEGAKSVSQRGSEQ
jgi:hypothetical protein